jgi:hypothetical protein
LKSTAVAAANTVSIEQELPVDYCVQYHVVPPAAAAAQINGVHGVCAD